MSPSSLARNSGDFIFGDNGHARLSQTKVAELLGVVQSTVSKALNNYSHYTKEEAEFITRQGFDGDSLSRLVVYYAFDSRQARKETKERCRNMILKTSAKGFQDFIDTMAGIEQVVVTNAPQQLSLAEEVRFEAEILNYSLSLGGLDPKLISGVVLNHVGLRLPQLKQAIGEGHSLLATSLPSELLLTPTKIGETLGISARKVNLLLLELGYQVKNLGKKSKCEPDYFPTDIGKPYANNTLATGRLLPTGADNATYQHLKWQSQIVEVLRGQLVGI